MKQDGAQQPTAGQYNAHEEARSLQPLLFSYANKDLPYLCTMRLGRMARVDDYARRPVNGVPVFCEKFSTDGGSCTRNLKVVSPMVTSCTRVSSGV